MSNKFKKNNQNTAVSEAAKIVKSKTDQMALHFAAREQAIYIQISTLLIANGAKILQDDFGMSVEDSAKWAQATLRKSREELKPTKTDS